MISERQLAGRKKPRFAAILAELGYLLSSVPFVLATITGEFAHGQSIAAPDEPVASRPLNSENSGGSNGIAYCPDLKHIIALALTQEKFAAIARNPRDGDFLETSILLTGWKDCSLYGSRTYTCDSQDLTSVEEVARVQTVIVNEIKSCLGE